MTLTSPTRIAQIHRHTAETDVRLALDLDGPLPPAAMTVEAEGMGPSITTGLGYFDHMLAQLAKHGGFGLSVQAKGDLHVDSHHLVEDVGLSLGDALREALGDRRGIARWGEAHVPMDETLARVVVDLSGRPYCVFEADLPRVVLGDGFQVEMVREFFIATAMRGALNLHASILYGENTHHRIEALFKGLARALKIAVRLEHHDLPTTKGTLTT